MKTLRLQTAGRLASAAIALSFIFGVADLAIAQQKGSARGAGLRPVQKFTAPAAARETSVQHNPSACPDCKDTVLKPGKNLATKGAAARTQFRRGIPTPKKTIHTCEACEFDWQVTGHGKMKQRAFIHTCSSKGEKPVNCCAT